LAIAVADAVEAVKDASVMNRVNVGIIGQAARSEHITFG
jgi:hypothetical protein